MKHIVFTSIFLGMTLFLGFSAPSSCRAAENMPAAAAPVAEETAHEKARNTVIARVGTGQITLGQVMNKIKEVTIKKYGFKEITPTLAERIKADAIEKLINEELAYLHTKKIGIKVSPAEIKEHVDGYKKSLGGDDKFREYLLSNDLTIEDYSTQAERFLAVKKALAKEVDAKIREVTEEDLVKAYSEAKEQYFVQQERVMVTDITFFLDPEEKETLQKITAIRKQLVEELSGDISKLASDPSFIVRDNLTLNAAIDQGLHDVATKLQVQGISEPVNIKGTYHLVKLLYYTPRVEKTFAEVRPYLKKKIQEKLKQDRIDEWRQNIRKDADIEIFETKME